MRNDFVIVNVTKCLIVPQDYKSSGAGSNTLNLD